MRRLPVETVIAGNVSMFRELEFDNSHLVVMSCQIDCRRASPIKVDQGCQHPALTHPLYTQSVAMPSRR